MPRLLLWPDVIDELKLRDRDIRQVRPNVGKYHVSVEKHHPSNSVPVHALYVLNVAPHRVL